MARRKRTGVASFRLRSLRAIVVSLPPVLALLAYRCYRFTDATTISQLGAALSEAGRLIGAHDWHAALAIVERHDNAERSQPILDEVAEGIRARLRRGQQTAQRQVLLHRLGGALGDALARAEADPPSLPAQLDWSGRGTITLLSLQPLVLTVDGWLGDAANASLERLPTDFARSLSSAVQPATTTRPSDPRPALCLPLQTRTARAQELEAAVRRSVDAAVAAADAGQTHCAATAALSRRRDGALSAFRERSGPPGSLCGPLTSGLAESLVRSETAIFDPGASAAADALDAGISAMLGFAFDPERVAAMGVAPFLKGADSWPEEAAALRDAYDFSTGPQLTRYREARRGGFATHTDCHDFDLSKTTERSHTALLYVEEPSAGGGETAFPALNLKVAPKRGRLLLFGNLLSDGTCDPRSAHESVALERSDEGGAPDKLILQKWFYLDRQFDRAVYNIEGKPRGAGYASCDRADCRLYERVQGDPSTLELLRLDRAARVARRAPPMLGRPAPRSEADGADEAGVDQYVRSYSRRN